MAVAPTLLTAAPAQAATASATLTPATATAESNVSTVFTLSVTCNGPGTCDGMVVSIPTNAVTGNGTRTDFGSWISGAACPGITRAVSGGQLTFTYASLLPGTQNCAFTVRAPEYTTLNGAVATLTPTVSGPGLPTVTGTPAQLTVTAGHNVSTAISGQAKVISGASFTYNLILNCGANRAYDGDIGLSAVRLAATLPANFVYEGFTPRNGLPGSYTTPAVGSTGGTFVYDDPTGASCGNPPLNVDNAIVITVRGSVTGPAGTQACATVTSTYTYIDRTTPESGSATTAPCPTVVDLAVNASKTGATQSMGNVGQYLFGGQRYPYTFPGDWDQSQESLSYVLRAATNPAAVAAGLAYRIDDPLPCLDNLAGNVYSSNASGVLCQNPGVIPVRITVAGFTPAPTDAVQLLFADGTTADVPFAAGAWTMPVAPASPIAELRFPPFIAEGANTAGTITFTVDGYASPDAVPGRVLRNTSTTQAYVADAADPTGSPIGDPIASIANVGLADLQADAGEPGATIVQPYLTHTVSGTCTVNVGLRSASGRAATIEITKTPSEPIYINYLAAPGATIVDPTVSPALRGVYVPTRTFSAGALTATVTPDYNGTGRTMYAWVIPAGVVSSPGLYQMLSFAFVVTLPAGCAGTYASDLTMGYEAPITKCVWTNFVSPFAQDPPLAPTNNDDLDTNGSPIADNYCGYSVPITVAAINPGFAIQKQVQGSLDAAPAPAGTTGKVGASGGEATYTVTFSNTGASVLDDAVVYDLLPRVGDTEVTTLDARDSQFAVTLASVPTVPSGVTVEYSAAENPCRDEVLAVNPGCVDDWSATPPSPLSSTTGLRFLRAGVLAVSGGGTSSFTASYDVTTPAITAGRIAWNSVGANAEAAGAGVGAAESTYVGLEAAGQPAILKSSSAASFDAAGDTITFTYVVTNEASVPVTDVSVTDVFTDAAAGSSPGAVTCQTLSAPAGTCSGATTDLAPGQTATFTMSYTARQADLEHGGITDLATVTASPARGPALSNTSNEVTVTADQNPALSLTKTVSPTTVTAAGQSVSYSFAVLNSGNVTLESLGIAETAFSGSGTTPLASCALTTLAPGAGTTCTASYAITQPDMDAGSVSNTAVAAAEFQGAGVLSPASSALVSVTQNPSLTLVKSANLASIGSAGQAITFTFAVSNDGNVTMDAIAVSEVSFSGTNALGAIDCPATQLAPGDDMTCTAAYAASQPDIDSGSIDNEATVTGTDPAGTPLAAPPSSSISIPVVFAPALTLAKAADVTNVSKPGTLIRYSFEVINNGNTTLTDLRIDETAFTGAGAMSAVDCPLTTLAPTDSTVCTAAYTVVPGDASASRISNTAEAVASYSAAGAAVTVTSVASTAVVTVDPALALALTGTSSPVAWLAVSTTAMLVGGLILLLERRRRRRA